MMFLLYTIPPKQKKNTKKRSSHQPGHGLPRYAPTSQEFVCKKGLEIDMFAEKTGI